MVVIKQYIWKQLIAFDQSINALFNGDADETISSRAGKAMINGKRWGCVLCRVLDWFDKGHCIKNIEYDEGEKL